MKGKLVQSHIFLIPSTPKGSGPCQSTKGRGLIRNGHQRLYPKHCLQPFLTRSPVLLSSAEPKAVPHSQPGGPCSHSFRSGCLQHTNHAQTFYEQQTGEFTISLRRTKKVTTLFYFQRDGCFEYLQPSSGRQMGCPWIKWTWVYNTDISHAHIYKLCVVYSIINQ